MSVRKEERDIKTMRLYSHVERIETELRKHGLAESTKLDPIELGRFDSMHYGGNVAVQSAVDASPGLDSSSCILDVGSGLGGPARYLGHTVGCRVVALELQSDLHAKAVELTRRCRLDHMVTHVHGSILDDEVVDVLGGPTRFDAVVSWLAFLHVPDKVSLFSHCAEVLKPDGRLFIEDFFVLNPLTTLEKETLETEVYAANLPTKEEYIHTLERAGFIDIGWVEMTSEWGLFVSKRLSDFVTDRDAFVGLHGIETFDSLLKFYSAVHALFDGGNLGGVRITATKSGMGTVNN